MKITEFRKLIREEVKKALKESIISDKMVSPSKLKLPSNTEEEGMLDAVQSKYQTKLVKKVRGTEGVVEIYQILNTPYIVCDESGFGVIFNASDMTAIVASIKDGSYFEWQ
jgi:hypothetical protein